MKIIKQKQSGKYCYLTFDNDTVLKVLSELYYQLNLYEGDEISEKRLSEVKQMNEDKMCLNSAFDLLSRRIHTEHELRTKLKKKFWNSNINIVIEECRGLNLLNDDYFAECYIQELISKGKGKFQIISSLKRKGISKDISDKYIAQLINADDELERAKNIAQRKMRSYRNEPADKVKEKLMRHLLSKGYSYEIIYDAIGSVIKS